MEDAVVTVFRWMLYTISFVFKIFVSILRFVGEVILYIYSNLVSFIGPPSQFGTFAYTAFLLVILFICAVVLLLVLALLQTVVAAVSNNASGQDEEDDEDDDEEEQYEYDAPRRQAARTPAYLEQASIARNQAMSTRPYVTFSDSSAKVVYTKKGSGNSWQVTVDVNGRRETKSLISQPAGSRSTIFGGKSSGSVEWGN